MRSPKRCRRRAKLMLAWRSAFQFLNLVRCPRLHTTTPVAVRQSGLEIFDDLKLVGCTQEAAANNTAGGTETLSVSREAGHAGYPARLALSSRDSSLSQSRADGKRARQTPGRETD